MEIPLPEAFDPPLDAVEQRLIDAVEAACRERGGDHRRLRQRLRNRAETYRELARRARFGGAAAGVGDIAARLALYKALLARLDAASDRPSS
jgi:hypothetical protein